MYTLQLPFDNSIRTFRFQTNSIIFCSIRREKCAGCWWGNLRERGLWGDQDVDGRIILIWKLEEVVGTGWSWLRIGTGGGHL
jgi:hypothetical protein